MIKLLREWLRKRRIKTGTLEGIELTFGDMGHQLTTIDGETYYTWWDFKTWPKTGDKIEFACHEARGVLSWQLDQVQGSNTFENPVRSER